MKIRGLFEKSHFISDFFDFEKFYDLGNL
jgi:hypothetical protein